MGGKTLEIFINKVTFKAILNFIFNEFEKGFIITLKQFKMETICISYPAIFWVWMFPHMN